MVKKVLDLQSDLNGIKSVFGLGKKKSFKQRYEERLKEREKEKEEQMYEVKLEELDKDLTKVDKVKRKLKELLK